MPDVEPVLFSIALHIALRESLLINCATASQRVQLRASLIQSGAPEDNLFMAVVPSNDTWARDHGPLTVFEHGEPRLVDFRFNGWRNKYLAQAGDDTDGHIDMLAPPWPSAKFAAAGQLRQFPGD